MNTQTLKKGRPVVYTTPAEKQKAYERILSRSNEKRRKLYAEDPEYRLKVLDRNRKRYRDGSTSERFHKPPTRKFPTRRIAGYVETLPVTDILTDTVVTLPVLNFQRTGDFLGIGRSSVYRWQQQGKLPGPTLFTEQGQGVYSKQQILAVAAVIASQCHGKVAYYRASDNDVVSSLYAAFAQASDLRTA